MNEGLLEDRKAFLTKLQKKINRLCFNECFSVEKTTLDKECFSICAAKFIKCNCLVYEHLKERTRFYRAGHYFKLFLEIDPLLKMIFDDKVVKYRLEEKYFQYVIDSSSHEKI